LFPPQKRSKRLRAFSNTSDVDVVVRLPDGELTSGSNIGSSKQRNVDPGTGLSYRISGPTPASVSPAPATLDTPVSATDSIPVLTCVLTSSVVDDVSAIGPVTMLVLLELLSSSKSRFVS